jgi:hypothetical protein
MFSATIPHYPQHINAAKRYQRLKRMACIALTVVTGLAATITVTAGPVQAGCSNGQTVTAVRSLTANQSSEDVNPVRSFTLSRGVAWILAVGKKGTSRIELSVPATGRFICNSKTREDSYADQNVTVCIAEVTDSDLGGRSDREFKVIVKNLSNSDSLEYHLICLNGPPDARVFFKQQQQQPK